MSTLEYPDVNKIWDGRDTLLCWAAAVSNALYWTGWADQTQFNAAEEVFTIFRDKYPNQPGGIYFGVSYFFHTVLKNYDSLSSYLHLYPASLLWLGRGLRQDGVCGIAILRREENPYTHLVAFYDMITSSESADDPRQVTQIIYSDSDDMIAANRVMNVSYSLKTKRYETDYDTPAYYIEGFALLFPPSSSKNN